MLSGMPDPSAALAVLVFVALLARLVVHLAVRVCPHCGARGKSRFRYATCPSCGRDRGLLRVR